MHILIWFYESIWKQYNSNNILIVVTVLLKFQQISGPIMQTMFHIFYHLLYVCMWLVHVSHSLCFRKLQYHVYWKLVKAIWDMISRNMYPALNIHCVIFNFAPSISILNKHQILILFRFDSLVCSFYWARFWAKSHFTVA